MNCFFVTDLHGHIDRYKKLFLKLADEKPQALFIGGDLFPHVMVSRRKTGAGSGDFLDDFLINEFSALREVLKDDYPEVFLILGNDDGRFEEKSVIEYGRRGFWHYIHNKKIKFGINTVYGYACVPPTPFMLKDWERYDVSRYVDPGCVSPEKGYHTVKVSGHQIKFGTIAGDLETLAGSDDMDRAIMLFHTPPYKTNLDRADLAGKSVDYAPLDPHVGSVAVRKFIEKNQPLITMHGHIHESVRLTDQWRDKIGRTHLFSAAHDGPELAVIKFNTDNPESATRELI
jgi:Icc-related predicted phosphoesterase